MTRDEMIDWLIEDDLNGWTCLDGSPNEASKSEYLSMILYEGFKGYNNYTDNALRAEILERDPDEVLGD